MTEALRTHFIESVAFAIDPFQQRSMDLLDRGESVLVAAPTGSGKTLVGQYAIDITFAKGLRSFYTTPLKALSNQKYYELCATFGRENVGLLTGDNSIRADAPMVVMTTEVLRNMIYAGTHDLGRVGLVVLDEVHYLQNPYRGAVWEEVIIHLPLTTRLVCLSATVSNAEEFATWMRTVRGSMEAVIEERRPVDLEHVYLFGDRRTHRTAMIETFIEDRLNPAGADLDPPWLSTTGLRRGARPKAFAPKRPDVVELLADSAMLPAIYFIFSRAGCDDAVRELLHAGVRLTSSHERTLIRKIVDERLDSIAPADLAALRFREFMSALEAGIAAHHAGMVPPFREVVEACFEQALVKVVFATETLALGINMPARSVVVEKLTKFNGERHDILSGGEYTQLAGRAGRRGMDDIGYCAVLWNPSTTFAQAASLAQTRSYPISSSFRPTYNMATNLIRRYDEATAKHLLNLSFAQFGADSEVVEMEAELARMRRRFEEVDDVLTCEFGDIERYATQLLSRERDQRRRPTEVIREVSSVRFDRLRVGDILSMPLDDAESRLKLIVVSIGFRGRSKIKVTVVSTGGRAYRIGLQYERVVRVEGTEILPKPYEPNSKEFRRVAALALQSFSGPGLVGGEPNFSPTGPQGRSGSPGDVDEEGKRLAQCPDFRDHLTFVRRRQRLSGRIEELARKIHTKQASLALQLDRVLSILDLYGVVQGWSLTEEGERLSRLYSESDLLCSLALDRGIFDGLDPPSLSAVVSTLTYEGRPSFKAAIEAPTKGTARRMRSLHDLWLDLSENESMHRLPITREPDIGFGLLIYRWAHGADLERTLDGFTIPPGDFVRNTKQTLDLLRQIGEVAANESTRRSARSAVGLLMRGVVAVSSAVDDSEDLVERPEVQSSGDEMTAELS